eukprot:1509254-Pyramimonas_sp.AAC.1
MFRSRWQMAHLALRCSQIWAAGLFESSSRGRALVLTHMQHPAHFRVIARSLASHVSLSQAASERAAAASTSRRTL